MRRLCKFLGACLSAALFAACGGSSGLSSSTSPVQPSQAASATARMHSIFLRQRAFRVRNAGELVLYSFAGGSDGGDPEGGVIQYSGTLYGTTRVGGVNGSQCPTGCGTVFSFTGSTERVLHTFTGADGTEPKAGLTSKGGNFYGTTSRGGTDQEGTVFAITPSGTEHVVYSFTDGISFFPLANVIDGKPLARRTLYGTTAGDGAYGFNSGSVFELIVSRRQQGRYSLLHAFAGPPDGSGPESPLVVLDGQLYGTTINGGHSDNCQIYSGGQCGTLYSITTSGQEHVKWEFGISGGSGPQDGVAPSGQLAVLNGLLYGTTQTGGLYSDGWPYGAGVVYSYNPYGFSYPETVLHVFDPQSLDGSYPRSGLILVNGNFYGTTYAGGAYGGGTAFEITPSGTETILHNFGNRSSNDGANPSAGLLYYRGRLFGTTTGGGTHGGGTIFVVSP